MKIVGMLAVAGFGIGVAAWVQQASGQQPPPTGKTQGPGVQNLSDPRYQDTIKTCKTPPPARGGGRGGAKGGPKGGAKGGPKGGPGGEARGGAAQTFPRDYTVTAIPGVIAAGQKWKDIWTVEGNNADGIIATSDGGILLAQNDNSQVVKLDKDGKESVAYSGLNTSGSVAMNSKGALFVVNRGLNPSIEEVSPKRQTLANKMDGDSLDCLGQVMNDVTADSKGGAYFTMGGLFHTDSKGVVKRYGENLNTNGIMLSADEKHLWVTNGGTLAEFDVQKDGSLTNQHEFVKLAGGGDGSTFDSMGRLYVTDSAGVEVISPEGKVLGAIPTPRGVISVTISGPDKKTLYAVARTGNTDWIIGIPLIAQGPKGRGK